LAASKELRLSRLYPKSKYDPDNGLLQLAVSSRSEAVPETIAALTDLEIFPAGASPATEQEPARS